MADIKIAGRIKAGAADNIAGYASEILFDDEASDKTVKEKLEGKQDTLTFDNVPTKGSNNPVKSGGVYQAIQDIDVSSQISGKADKSEMSVVAGTGANADKTTITLKSGTSATVLTQHQDVSEFLREGEVFGTGDDSTASFNPYADTVWNKQQTLSESQKQQIRENIGVSVTDSEDIQSVNGTLKFADRAYTATTSSVQGNMGYKILRKGSTFASQVTTANTIYEIRYDYDLNAQTVTIPANCVLKFDGGSVKNGTITGNDTKIKSESNVIFEGVTFAGSFIGGVDSEWFSIVYGTSYDNSAELNSLLNLAYLSSNKYVKLRYSSTIYVNSVDENLPRPFSYYIGGTVQIKSGVTLDLNSAEIRCITNSNPRYNILYAGKDDTNTNTKNICIKNGSIIGDYGVRTSDSYEQGHGIALLGVDGFVLKNLTIKSCNGDGLLIDANSLWISDEEETDSHKKNRHNQHGLIERCVCDGNKRQGMSMDAMIECDVIDCLFKNANGISPKDGVDIEPAHSSKEVSGVVFRRCQFLNNGLSGLALSPNGGSVTNVVIDNCVSNGNLFAYSIAGDSISLLSCNTKDERANIRFRGSVSDCVLKNCYLSNIAFHDTTATPHSTINGILFKDCDILVTSGNAILFNQAFLSFGGVEFNGCVFDWSTSGVTYFVGNVNFSKTIDSLLFYDCIFNLRGSAANMILYHYDFVKCRFNNMGIFIYIYDGVHNEFVFKDCEILSKTTSYLFLLYSLVAGTSHIFSLDNIVLLQGSTQNSGLMQINSYSTQQITLNLANAMSYIRIPGISPSTEASAYTINGTFRYPSLLSGATTSRPVAAVAEGSNFFDTTANKAEWFIGGTWVDATGTVV